MPSHVYFFASATPPVWEAPMEALPNADEQARVQRVVSALLANVPGMVEQPITAAQLRAVAEGMGPAAAGATTPWWADLYVPALTIDVQPDHLHAKIPYWARPLLLERDLTGNLQRIARTVREIAGWDFFEHGDQGLGERADISRVIDIVSGTGERMLSAFAEVLPPEQMPEQGPMMLPR